MIHGSLSGHVGDIYLYYKGPQRVVLSDVNITGSIGPGGVSTGLRIVLFPREWTTVPYESIRVKFETGTSQLNHLVNDGWVELYTDKEEAAKVKAAMSSETKLDPRLRDGVYIKHLKDANKYTTIPVPQETKAIDEHEGFVMEKPKHEQRFFDLNNFPKPTPYADNKPTVQNVASDDKADKMFELLKVQYEQSSKQAEQLSKMVETTQQLVAAVLASLKK